ncbi:MAG TPA: SusD/RagB family nutrient-binding outer membrane lipoprotein [Puia sp.]|uniref:SusD/RagB family nutrient-binding outer membrane lipoprotein n=1 Tax=Puia sp. TaxID=2045100 RepID=UPI002C33A8AB|nr:SusD/RagB family nutrient-binding outer membrane lipoprotein [Puia sp.]HVU97954.1 SusD/RagB family nutrient-binding outer membrane lipoprotein [Puia sp.]
MNKRKYIVSISIACLALGACKKSAFVETNLNPTTLYSVDPADQFLAAAAGCQDDFEYFYDVYRSENNWLQYTTSPAGNTPGFARVTGNFNERYSKIFYGRVGTYLSDIPHLIAQMKPGDAAKRVYQQNIAAIFKAYYAFYVSDINGDIPYTQAFEARYGGTLTPAYDRQATLFDTLDAQIKAAVKVLETPQAATQVPINAKDPFFPNGISDPVQEATQWAKIGNAVRLKMAMRLMKRDPAKMKSIVTEVLADATQMASTDDSWALYAGPGYANGAGNYNPVGFCAAKPVIDFMNTTGDPRLKMFYRPALKTMTFVGAPTSPDDVAANTNNFLHSDSVYSQLQHRLFAPNYDENDGNGAGTGIAFFPLLTYAEYCFIRAELGNRGITGDDAATWYNKGVTASITYYDQRAVAAGIAGYNKIAAGDITTYLAQPKVAYNPATGLDQIVCQAYLDFFRQPSEAWAWWKRTGLPSTTSTIAWEALSTSGTPIALPRRAAISVLLPTDRNYDNQQAAFKNMTSDGNWGTGPNDFSGRVWWDMP